MMKDKNGIPFYIVDAFTSEPFKGNPAAVCLLTCQREDALLQSIAAEFNLSETAFILNPKTKKTGDPQSFSLRWFTPKIEVPLCGHGTLATAAVLFHELDFTGKLTFKTRSGELTATEEHDSIVLNFPDDETVNTLPNQDLLREMGINDFEDVCLSKTLNTLLIRLENEEDLLGLEPDFERMKSISTKEQIKGIIVTSKGHSPYDFVSRVFAPWLGVNEDPVTGSAHTVLAPYWAKILGKQEMLAFQASSRGGELRVRVHKNSRVDLIGKTVIISKGEMNPYARAKT
jgi:PhzF family phenazine biosynthesis protein